jgi:hypothetical protein
MFANPFFRLNIGRFKATVLRVVHPSMLNRVFGSSGFCYDSASNPLAILGTSRNGLGDRWHIVDGSEKNRQNLPAVANWAKPLGPTSAICQRSPQGKLDASPSRSKIRQIW